MKKNKKIVLSLCAAIAMVSVAGGIQSYKPAKVTADGQAAVTYVSTDSTTLAAWENAGYGKDGYLVFDSYRNGTGAGFYSDMYNITGTDTTVAETTLMKMDGAAGTGWVPAASGGWDLTKNDDGTIAMNSTTKVTADNTDSHSLKSDAVISSWGVNAAVFQGHGTRPRKPNIPGSTTQTQLRMQTTNDNSTLMADVNVGFTLNTSKKVDVTLQVYNHTDNSTAPIVVDVYGLGYEGGRYTYTKVTKDIESVYGEDVLASTTVTANGAYVTFTLDGSIAQDYTFVAYRGDTSTTSFPSIGGVFFDYSEDQGGAEEPDGEQSAATYVSTDTTTVAAWESAGYGADGYFVFDGYRNGAGVGFYSDMYNIGATDTTVSETTLMKFSGSYSAGWTPATSGGWDLTKNADGTIAMNSTTKTTTNNTDTHTLKSDAIISSWGVNATTFQGHGTRPRKPYIPGSITNTQLRMQTTNDNSTVMADVNVGFTLNTDKKVNVTLQVYDHTDAITTPNIVVAVYGLAYQGGRYTYTKAQKDIASCYGDEVLATTTVTTSGAYVTFTLDGSVAKDYTFVAYRSDSTATTSFPSIGGVFFDYCDDQGGEAPTASFDSVSLTLDGTIGINYYMNISDEYATNENAFVLLTNANGETIEAAIPAPELDGTYKFTIRVAAKDIKKMVSAQMFVDGEAVTAIGEYSVAAYCNTVLNASAGKYSEKLVDLAKALMDYGNASDNYFNGSNNEFIGAVENVTIDDLMAYAATQENSLPAGVVINDLSLVLESETSLKIYFSASSLDDIVCKVGGVVVTPVATGRTNEYCITIDNIAAKDLGNVYQIMIGDYVVNSSALTYGYLALRYEGASDGIVNVVKALYLYNQAAIAYFAK